MDARVRPATKPATVLRTSATKPCRSVRRSARQRTGTGAWHGAAMRHNGTLIVARPYESVSGRSYVCGATLRPMASMACGGRPGQPSSGHPVARHEQPERQPRLIAVARGTVAGSRRRSRASSPPGPRVVRPGPRVEDQPGVPADRHHDVRGRVRSHAREREERPLELVVGQFVRRRLRPTPPGRARRRPPAGELDQSRRRDSRRGPRLDRRPRGCRPAGGRRERVGERPAAADRRRRRDRSTIALTMRSVALHAQFVVQTVFTTSSKTVGLCSIRPAPVAAQARSGSFGHPRRSPRDRGRGAAPGAPPRPRRPGPKDPRPVRGSRRRRRSSGPHGCAHGVVCHVSCAA